MAEDTTLTSETWLVAIDIGKVSHAVLVEGSDGKRQQFRMANQVEDYDRLVGFLRGLPGLTRIALEPTGDFHRTWPTGCSGGVLGGLGLIGGWGSLSGGALQLLGQE
jgi:hypothetical protein